MTPKQICQRRLSQLQSELESLHHERYVVTNEANQRLGQIEAAIQGRQSEIAEVEEALKPKK